MMKRTKMLSVIFSVGLLLTGCGGYEVPQGFTKVHHSYDELTEYAQGYDPQAVVEEDYRELKEQSREFRLYPAVINGVDCTVGSVSDYIYDRSGEFTQEFYKMDTDYDFYVIKEVLEGYPELGTIGDESVSTRYQNNGIISSKIVIADMTPEMLDDLYAQFEEMSSELKPYDLFKEYWLQIETGGKRYYFVADDPETKQTVYDQMTEDSVF